MVLTPSRIIDVAVAGRERNLDKPCEADDNGD
jgi:hypothetical protein